MQLYIPAEHADEYEDHVINGVYVRNGLVICAFEIGAMSNRSVTIR